jgi:rhomboid family GlyGly-CTERM serine protease
VLNRLPWRTLGIAAAVMIAAAIPGAFDAFALEGRAVVSGELWRVVTGHAVHATPYHLLWNVGPLVLLGLLFEPVLRGRLWTVLGVSALTVGVGMLALAPEVVVYCGLSGVLNGLLLGGALLTIRKDRAAGSVAGAGLMTIAIALTLGKIVFEAAFGHAIFTDVGALGGEPVPLAHALGALGGLIGAGREKGEVLHRDRRQGAAPGLPQASTASTR